MSDDEIPGPRTVCVRVLLAPPPLLLLLPRAAGAGIATASESVPLPLLPTSTEADCTALFEVLAGDLNRVPRLLLSLRPRTAGAASASLWRRPRTAGASASLLIPRKPDVSVRTRLSLGGLRPSNSSSWSFLVSSLSAALEPWAPLGVKVRPSKSGDVDEVAAEALPDNVPRSSLRCAASSSFLRCVSASWRKRWIVAAISRYGVSLPLLLLLTVRLESDPIGSPAVLSLTVDRAGLGAPHSPDAVP